MNLEHLRALGLGVIVLGLALVAPVPLLAAQPASAEPGVMLVLDASGSMTGNLGEHTKIELARETSRLLAQEFSDQGMALGLVTLGNQRLTCQSAAVAVPLARGRSDEIFSVLRRTAPLYRAKTPLVAALRLAAAQAGPSGKVVLMTDGMDTCELNPCDLPSAFSKDGTGLVVIGLNVPEEEESALQCLADAAGGTYLSAYSKQELETVTEVASTLVTLPLNAAVAQARDRAYDPSLSTEIFKVQQQRDRALAAAAEMRNRQQALVALIDDLKDEVKVLGTKSSGRADRELSQLRERQTRLENVSTRQARRIRDLEQDLIDSREAKRLASLALEESQLEIDRLEDRLALSQDTPAPSPKDEDAGSAASPLVCQSPSAAEQQCRRDLAKAKDSLTQVNQAMEQHKRAFAETFLLAEKERETLAAQLDLAREKAKLAEEAQSLAQLSLEVRNQAFTAFAAAALDEPLAQAAPSASAHSDLLRLEAAEAALAQTRAAHDAKAEQLVALKATLEALSRDLERREKDLAARDETNAQLNEALARRDREHQDAQAALRTTMITQSQKRLDQALARKDQDLAAEKERLEANHAAALAQDRALARQQQVALQQRFADLSTIYEALKQELFSQSADEAERLAEMAAELDLVKSLLEEARADQSRLRGLLTQNGSAIPADGSRLLRFTQNELAACLTHIADSEAAFALLASEVEQGQSDLDQLEFILSEQEQLIDDLISRQLACILPARVVRSRAVVGMPGLDRALQPGWAAGGPQL